MYSPASSGVLLCKLRPDIDTQLSTIGLECGKKNILCLLELWDNIFYFSETKTMDSPRILSMKTGKLHLKLGKLGHCDITNCVTYGVGVIFLNFPNL